MTKVWALLVVSTDSQADTLANQRAWAQQTADRNGWDLERIVGDDGEGVGSGKAGPRPIVVRMISELRGMAPATRPTWLLVIRADRFARGKIQDTLFVQDEIINELGVRILTRDDGEITLDGPEAEFMAAFRAYYARKDNAVRRDKALAKYSQRRAAGLEIGNRRPYGLARGPHGETLVVPDQADIVRRIFELRLTGLGCLAIGRRVMDTAPPRRRKDGSEVPIHWGQVPVKRILATRAYIGTIVDEVTWHRAQAIGEDQARRFRTPNAPIRRWPLTGSLRCYCGRTMRGATGGKKIDGTRLRYYRCSGRAWNHGDTPFTIRAELAEEQFGALLDGLYGKHGETHTLQTGGRPSIELIDRALRERRAELVDVDKLRRAAWSLHAAGKVNDDEVQARLDDVAAQRNEIAERIAELERERGRTLALAHDERLAAETIRGARRVWRSPKATPDEQRRIVMAVATFKGGLFIDIDGQLQVGTPPDPSAQTDSRWRRFGAF